ncbi:hypothetical protein HETIRDRAFT_430866 [Heterobasidion irregulare TC 32-1]|uniref:Uncharacterized protein n=1 Tax=Heterobasidion irregulare (strain TC 32-1) TaxID=747525 RepID=W4JPQ1_HETIT|nr:uncharacterized protein HETIRDRAFT_430866 [Heterobasidion irregulare TC 32-1]ETW75552.1 hypothetical protein HETIRDRAFT_430866 [Heterobasidion irregulare TC 32-1]
MHPTNASTTRNTYQPSGRVKSAPAIFSAASTSVSGTRRRVGQDRVPREGAGPAAGGACRHGGTRASRLRLDDALRPRRGLRFWVGGTRDERGHRALRALDARPIPLPLACQNTEHIISRVSRKSDDEAIDGELPSYVVDCSTATPRTPKERKSQNRERRDRRCRNDDTHTCKGEVVAVQRRIEISS